MIRKLTETDRADLEALLRASPHFNVYMLGNVVSLGVNHELSDFWGDFADQAPGELRGVLNRYMTGWSVFGRGDCDWRGLAHVVDTYPETATRLQDNPGGTSTFVPYFQAYGAARSEEEELMTLAREDFRPTPYNRDVDVRPAGLGDLDALTEFYAGAGAMQRTRKGVERPLRDGFLWIAEAGGAIRGAALTNAIGGGYAMIGGVYTHPDWRGHGISQAVCSALCTALLAAGLTPSLYWIAPAAGHIYRKLGFKAVGAWRSVWLQSKLRPPK